MLVREREVIEPDGTQHIVREDRYPIRPDNVDEEYRWGSDCTRLAIK